MSARSHSLLSIFGSAFRYGQPKLGVEKAPALMSKFGVAKQLRSDGNKVKHWGTNYPKIKDTTERTVGLYNQILAKRVARDRKAGRRIINLGGDNSTSIGSINGVLHHDPDAIVVWVDAHADINTQSASKSGNMHGMPLAYLTGLEDPLNISRSSYLTPKLGFDQFVYIGTRDIDPFEQYIIDINDIPNYTADIVATEGIDYVIEDMFDRIDPRKEKPIHLMFDIDAIDPMFAPGTGTPVSDGLDVGDAWYLCKYFGSTGRVVSMDMVEVNPELDNNDITTKLALSLVNMTFNGQKPATCELELEREMEKFVIGMNKMVWKEIGRLIR